MSYVDEVLAKVKEKNASEPEFLQAVEEVLNSLRPVIDANEDKYRREALLERICEPERQFKFRVPWVYPDECSGAQRRKLAVAGDQRTG